MEEGINVQVLVTNKNSKKLALNAKLHKTLK
jgi:hypothetical protein